MAQLFSFGEISNLNWANTKSQLLPLGITDQQLYFIIGLIGIFCCYYVLRPVLRWLIALNMNRLLTYIVAGVGMLFLLILYKLYQETSQPYNLQLKDLASGILGITFFGGILFVIELVQSIFRLAKGKNSNVQR
ncbi:hypothetical protein NC797_04515 [Aquibacillus sp. 3ASR75-11]|uniref:Uncharacterized protein n=1 Tax=Terrihalobacillus insolitus TaxID=2950438 RepID=A0A9X3WT54_9BACI|nr:hypothetical protein [Terrihalobacillus insolitus]MDC3412752.1 hypothetical protein [Terrihalobacillus insolitus]MDC3423771.1 hypothetical protein [Terrihalobacillus insolitus]